MGQLTTNEYIWIKTSGTYLQRVKNNEDMLNILKKQDIPFPVVKKVACLCDLMRLPWVKSIRVELYYSCNVTTIDDMANETFAELKDRIARYNWNKLDKINSIRQRTKNANRMVKSLT